MMIKKIKNNHDRDKIWIYGKHPVLLVLKQKRRKIHQILTTKNNLTQLQKMITENKISIASNLIKLTDNNSIGEILPKDVLHQGLALQASIIAPKTEQNFLQQIENSDNKPLILILDQLTDPHNIGAIIRSAAAFNVKNIAITKYHFPAETAIIAKASSGMIELVDLIVASNINNFLANLKKLGYWSIGLDGSATKSIKEIAIQNYHPLALVIGSEGIGIRHLVKQNCDLLAKIAINDEVESLNASNAAAIALYELSSKIF